MSDTYWAIAVFLIGYLQYHSNKKELYGKKKK
jgi:hypothetical protein